MLPQGPLCPHCPREKSETALVTECLGSPSQEGLSRSLDLGPHPSRPGAPPRLALRRHPGQQSPVFPTSCPPSLLGTGCLRNLESQPRNQVWTHLQQRKPRLREGWSRQSGAGEAPPTPPHRTICPGVEEASRPEPHQAGAPGPPGLGGSPKHGGCYTDMMWFSTATACVPGVRAVWPADQGTGEWVGGPRTALRAYCP